VKENGLVSNVKRGNFGDNIKSNHNNPNGSLQNPFFVCSIPCGCLQNPFLVILLYQLL